jgi:hypothetical protein
MPGGVTLRGTWRLGGLGNRYVIVRRTDVLPDEKFYAAPVFLISQLGRWLSDPFQRSVLTDLARVLFGWSPRPSPETDALLRARLEDAFRTGRLVVLGERLVARSSSPAKSAGDSPAAAPPAPGGGGGGKPPAPTKPKTWIRFKLVDQDDKPIPNERYKLKLTDGTLKEGRLDSDGSVFESGLDPGNCEISFPDLHEKDWVGVP